MPGTCAPADWTECSGGAPTNSALLCDSVGSGIRSKIC